MAKQNATTGLQVRESPTHPSRAAPRTPVSLASNITQLHAIEMAKQNTIAGLQVCERLIVGYQSVSNESILFPNPKIWH